MKTREGTPGGGRRFRGFGPVILIAVASFFFQLGFSTLNISTLPVYLAKELHKTQWLGLILGFQMFFDTVSRPFLGVVGDRLGRRWIVIAGPLLSAATAAVTVYISIGVLFIFRIIDGFVAGAQWTGIYAEAGDITDERHRNTAMSVINVASTLALALGPLAGGALDKAFGKRFPHVGQPAFLFSAVILVVGSGVAYKVFRPRPRKARLDTRAALRQGFGPRNLMFTVRMFPYLMIIAFLIYVGLGLVMPLMKLYAIDRYGMTELSFGYVLAIEAVLIGAVAVPLSRIGTKWGANKAAFLGITWITLALWLLTYSPWLILVFISAGLIGLGMVVALPAWLAFITLVSPPDRKGEVLGVIGLSQGVGMLLGSSLAGFLFARRHLKIPALAITSQNLAFFVSAAVLTLTSILGYGWVFKREARREDSASAAAPAGSARAAGGNHGRR